MSKSDRSSFIVAALLLVAALSGLWFQDYSHDQGSWYVEQYANYLITDGDKLYRMREFQLLVGNQTFNENLRSDVAKEVLKKVDALQLQQMEIAQDYNSRANNPFFGRFRPERLPATLNGITGDNGNLLYLSGKTQILY